MISVRILTEGGTENPFAVWGLGSSRMAHEVNSCWTELIPYRLNEDM
jgi:hypothetical protein